ncbi:MAG: sugar phosphate isomerase/epimerase [Phycisphaerales bacterium]|nr:sugar phosphate isomerase/epimerase [Phycisphaerales bacterium]
MIPDGSNANLPLPPLALAMLGLELPTPSIGDLDPASKLRAALSFTRAGGVGAVQLNAAEPGFRPRDLDRSARRELAALLRRSNLGLSGLDLFIPPEHFAMPGFQDRAVTAALAAIELLADLRSLVCASGSLNESHAKLAALSLMLPAQTDRVIIDQLAAASEKCSVRIADHHWAPPSTDTSQSPRITHEIIAPGLDPAAILMAGGDPIAQAAKLARTLASARLCDVSAVGRRAVSAANNTPFSTALGSGRLDVHAYAATLSACGYRGPVVIDLRQVNDPHRGLKQAVESWSA